MPRTFFLLLVAAILALPLPAAAQRNVSFSWGQSTGGVDIYRLGLRKDFGVRWFEGKHGHLGGYFEGSAAYWDNGGEDDTVFALSPVFSYSFQPLGSSGLSPFIEAGIGAAYVAKKVIDGRDLSSHFQFEDRIGLGVATRSGHRLSAHYFHYSNGGIKNPNDGIDIWLITYTVNF